MSPAEFIIIAVPTPVTRFKEPDLDFVRGAAESVGHHLRKGTTVILESTVYPGVTEEIMVPILESASGLRCGEDFFVAYCPERINPGDLEHTIEKSTKVVSGSTPEVADRVASLYGRIAGTVFVARDVRTAEAAKVIENVQRDLNIALVNELSIIFSKLGIDTASVLEAAATKWNFHRYSPGMVGGHCIPVDPYYLVHRAKELGYHPQVILAGRSINDSMPKVVAEMTVKALNDARKVIRDSRVLVMGLTYKEDVPDMRESPSLHLMEELAAYGCEVAAWDPLVADAELPQGSRRVANLDEAQDLDAIVIAVAHQSFRGLSLEALRTRMRRDPVLVDVRRIHERRDAEQQGFLYRTL
jgi:UDP-N-acetyl-D-glucosamine/UDP-N-acetyl-D-galactosamine dehydrogenase